MTRLIDADALKKELTPIKLYDGAYCKVITEKDIDNAPTIMTNEYISALKNAAAVNAALKEIRKDGGVL